MDAETAAAAAAKRNVEVTPLAHYRFGRVRQPGRQVRAVAQGLQLGFAAVDVKEIRRGVRELVIALEAERKAADRVSQDPA
jgi:DNA-binding transcriptional MocR family regulator